MKKYVRHPAFITIAVAKLLCGALFVSHYLRDLFIPFVHYFVDSRFSNPWEEFLRRGVLDAFPYSTVMLGVLALPQALAALVCGGVSHIPEPLAVGLMRLPLLAADLTIYLILCRWFETRWRTVLWLYWACPVLFYISYLHGQLDVIPTAFLFLSLWLATSQRGGAAGFLLATGIATKFHLAAAIPLIGFYLFKSGQAPQGVRQVQRFLLGLAGGLALWLGPVVFNPGYQALVLGAKEVQWLYALSWTTPQGVRLLLCPLGVLALIFNFFSFQRINRDVLILYTGLVYTALIVLVSPMPGWAYWSVPFLCYLLIRHDWFRNVPFWIYNACHLMYFGLLAPSVGLLEGAVSVSLNGIHFRDLIFTGMQSSLALAAWSIYRVGIRSYVKYRRQHSTTAIAIGGDSASGKHTLAETLAQVTGLEHTIRLHGDDYHRWPRDHDAWKSQTHLDPRSNYFLQPIEHIQELKNGVAITRSSYDHATGDFTEPAVVQPNQFILFEGLHPFVYQGMRDLFDIKIFLATQETLRRRWKITRDTAQRGHSVEKVEEEMRRREEDSRRYVAPQGAFADWVIEYALAEDSGELKARHQVSNAVVEIEALMDELTTLGGKELSLSWSMDLSLQRHVFEVRGRLSPSHVGTIARQLFPRLTELLASEPVWRPNLQGIEQLVFLALLNRRESR